MHNLASLLVFCAVATTALGETNFYIGAIGGISTLSADAGSRLSADGLRLSSYGADNGGALNVFGGLHLHNYFSLQANYVWNSNNVVFRSTSSGSVSFYEETRSSSQHAAIGDFLLYFRKRGSRFRPYLGTGAGLIHLSSSEKAIVEMGGSPALPPRTFSSTRWVFRSHVGIDVRLASKLDFRYSFSEFIGTNDFSKHLDPPGSRHLENFQNLFGLVLRF
jgi:hypothetical protein